MHYYFSDRGNAFNEDFCYAEENFGVLLDGASGLTDKICLSGNTDAQLLSHQLGFEIIKRITNRDISLAEVLRQAQKAVNAQFFNQIDERLEDWMLPSTTLSIFRINEEQLEIACLGDSPIMVTTKNNLDFFSDNKIGENDYLAITVLVDLMERGKTFEAAKKLIEPILLKNRKTKNSKAGYWIVDPTMSSVPHLVMKKYALSEVENVLLCSDGIYRLVELFHYLSQKELIDELSSFSKAVQTVDTLRKMETAENSMRTYPRFKESDDASIVYWGKD